MHPAFTRLRGLARDALANGGLTVAHLRLGPTPVEIVVSIRFARAASFNPPR